MRISTLQEFNDCTITYNNDVDSLVFAWQAILC